MERPHSPAKGARRILSKNQYFHAKPAAQKHTLYAVRNSRGGESVRTKKQKKKRALQLVFLFYPAVYASSGYKGNVRADSIFGKITDAKKLGACVIRVGVWPSKAKVIDLTRRKVAA